MPNKANAPLGTSSNPYNIRAIQPPQPGNAFQQSGENNGNGKQPIISKNNALIPENADQEELKSLLQVLLSAISSMNTDEKNPENAYVMTLTIKNGQPGENKTVDIKQYNPDTSDDIEFENFSGDNDGDDEYNEENDKKENTEKPVLSRNILAKPNDNKLQNPVVNPLNNSVSNGSDSSLNTNNPPVKTETSETKYTFRNYPLESPVNVQSSGIPINMKVPSNDGNKIYESFVQYPIQRNIPENNFVPEYIPNQSANPYLIPYQFVNPYNNIPIENNYYQPNLGGLNSPQKPTVAGENKVFDPYVQYNQRYVPKAPYRSEYISVPSNQVPEMNQNVPILANSSPQSILPENPAANPSWPFNLPSYLETSTGVPNNNPNTNVGNFNFQITNSRPPTFLPNTENYENSPEKNASQSPNIPNSTYVKPGSQQPQLIPLQKTNPVNISTNSDVKPVSVPPNTNKPSNLTDYNLKILEGIPNPYNASESNFTVPNQAPETTPLIKDSDTFTTENYIPFSTAPTQEKNTTTVGQTILNQTPGNSSLNDFPKNQSIPVGNNANPPNKKEIPFNNPADLLPQIINTNGNFTTNPANNVTNVDRTGSLNSTEEQQITTSIPLIIQTSTNTSTSAPQLGKSEPDSNETNTDEDDEDTEEDYDEDEDDDNYNDEVFKELLELLEYMDEIRKNITTQAPRNSSNSPTSTISPLTPNSEITSQQTTNSTQAPLFFPTPLSNLPIKSGINPANSSNATNEYFKPEDSFGSILEYILKFSNNPLFTSLRAPKNSTTQD